MNGRSRLLSLAQLGKLGLLLLAQRSSGVSPRGKAGGPRRGDAKAAKKNKKPIKPRSSEMRRGAAFNVMRAGTARAAIRLQDP